MRSKQNYGSMVYGSARKSYLNQLDIIHTQDLRLCLGGFRTSPVQSLYVKGLNLPSSILQNCPRILQIQHIVMSSILFSDRSDKTPTAIPTLGLRIKPHIVSAGLKVNITSEFRIPEKAPWLLQKPRVRLDLTRLKQIGY